MSTRKNTRLACIGLALLAHAGCAIRYTDSSGNQRITGFVNMTLPPSVSDDESYGYRLSTIGLLVHLSEELKGLSLGYCTNEFIILKSRDGELIEFGESFVNGIYYRTIEGSLTTGGDVPIDDTKM